MKMLDREDLQSKNNTEKTLPSHISQKHHGKKHCKMEKTHQHCHNVQFKILKLVDSKTLLSKKKGYCTRIIDVPNLNQ